MTNSAISASPRPSAPWDRGAANDEVRAVDAAAAGLALLRKPIEPRDALFTDHDVAHEVAVSFLDVGSDVADRALRAGVQSAFERASIVEGVEVLFDDPPAVDSFEAAFGVPAEGASGVANHAPGRVVFDRFAAVMGELIGTFAVFTVVVDDVERRDLVVGLNRSDFAHVVVAPRGRSDCIAGAPEAVAVVEGVRR